MKALYYNSKIHKGESHDAIARCLGFEGLFDALDNGAVRVDANSGYTDIQYTTAKRSTVKKAVKNLGSGLICLRTEFTIVMTGRVETILASL